MRLKRSEKKSISLMTEILVYIAYGTEEQTR